jgi:hypothetical protein
MSLADQAHEVAWLIDDDSEQLHDVAAENRHVQGLGIRERGVGALNGQRSSGGFRKSKMRCDGHRCRSAADTTELMGGKQR